MLGAEPVGKVAIGDQSPAVCVRDLSVHYPARSSASFSMAVSGVSFDVERGEILGVIGESGSGKSTLALTVAAQARHGHSGTRVPEICGGSISVLGTPLRQAHSRARNRVTLRVGYLAQDGAVKLNPRLTVADNIAEPIFQRDRRFEPREATQAVATLVDSVRLSLGVMNRLPHELSSGQRQRVALARSLILEPTLLVADEPTRGVDATVRSSVLDIIHELQSERGFSALVASSDVAVIDRVADRVLVLSHGVMIGLGTLDQLLNDPTHSYISGLAGVMSAMSDREAERID